MSTVQTQIDSVSIKPTSKGDLFVVKAGGTEYSTFARAMGEQARQLQGQAVVLTFTEKIVDKDGRTYTNRYYDGAEPSGFGTQPAFANQPSGMTQLAFPVAPPADNQREIKIMRQTATKVAAHLMPYLPESERTPTGLLAMADYLVLYYEHGSGSSAPVDPGPQPVPAGSFYDTQPSSDSDIPF